MEKGGTLLLGAEFLPQALDFKDLLVMFLSVSV